VARRADRLEAGAAALAQKGIKAAAFPADLGDPHAIAAVIARVRAALGPVAVIHWNAYSSVAGDLLSATPADVRSVLDVAVTGLVAAVQAALPDMKKAESPAVLVTNGGFGRIDPKVDAVGVQWGAMGLSMANAAKDKLVGLLSAKLKSEGVYVGQVTVMGVVKGTAFDKGGASLDPRTIAERFWSLYQSRTELRAEVG
jgi:NAD(P)-dependent dehydrogenase (short-subunit alcohol dehydrogenase family)